MTSIDRSLDRATESTPKTIQQPAQLESPAACSKKSRLLFFCLHFLFEPLVLDARTDSGHPYSTECSGHSLPILMMTSLGSVREINPVVSHFLSVFVVRTFCFCIFFCRFGSFVAGFLGCCLWFFDMAIPSSCFAFASAATCTILGCCMLLSMSRGRPRDKL